LAALDRVERAGLAEALAENARVLVNEDAHGRWSCSFSSRRTGRRQVFLCDMDTLPQCVCPVRGTTVGSSQVGTSIDTTCRSASVQYQDLPPGAEGSGRFNSTTDSRTSTHSGPRI